jgi:hypothetical protein
VTVAEYSKGTLEGQIGSRLDLRTRSRAAADQA